MGALYRLPLAAIALLGLFLCTISLGRAEQRRVAVVIANNQYQHAHVLANAVTDGKAIAAALKARGFDVMVGYDLDRRDMHRLLDDFVARLSADTIALLYYSGHGVQVHGDNYLIPVDLEADRESDLTDDGINLGQVIAQMSAVNNGFNIAILDACRDNPFETSSGRSLGGTRGLAPTTATGAMIVYAAGANQEAIDKLGPSDPNPNGLFTRNLLTVMRTPGLPIRDAITQVKMAVAKEAAAVGAKQTPAVYDEAIGDFTFTPSDAAAQPQPSPPAIAAPAEATDRDALFWESIKSSNDTKDFDAYLKRFPDGTFADLARNRLATLTVPARPSQPQPQQSQPAVFVPAKPVVRPSLVNGAWTGTYSYASGNNAPVTFNIQMQTSGDRLTGAVVEPNTFGAKSAPYLYAHIVGSVTGSSVSFAKTYDGTGGVSHSVQYSGQIAEDGQAISGQWSTGGLRGSFLIHVAKP